MNEAEGENVILQNLGLPRKRHAWLGLNADGVLLALLAFLTAADFFEPDLTDMARELGYVPPTFYLWTTLYVVGGLLMLAGFYTGKIGPELLGRVCLILGVGIQTFRTWTAFGWDTVTWQILIAAIIVTTLCAARARVLRRGVVVVVGHSHEEA